MSKPKAVLLSQTLDCPLCHSELIADNRIRLTRLIGWVITRVYECGCVLGGRMGSPMVIETECSSRNWTKKAA